MEKSIYIQRKRTAGFNLQAQSPDGRPVVSCTRPGKWGNPFVVGFNGQTKEWFVSNIEKKWHTVLLPSSLNKSLTIGTDKAEIIKKSVDLYKDYVSNYHDDIRQQLSNKHLSCWCKASEPCHVQDVLLPIINGEI